MILQKPRRYQVLCGLRHFFSDAAAVQRIFRRHFLPPE
jgi:hypothetical protein